MAEVGGSRVSAFLIDEDGQRSEDGKKDDGNGTHDTTTNQLSSRSGIELNYRLLKVDFAVGYLRTRDNSSLHLSVHQNIIQHQGMVPHAYMRIQNTGIAYRVCILARNALKIEVGS